MENIVNLPQARILIVDDNPSTAATLARTITRLSQNLEVISATDGFNALEQVNGLPVDLVITDMMMPDMNGLELIKKLRLQPGVSPTYTILITAYDIQGVKESARRLKVDEILIKPVHPERICQIVCNMLEELGPSTTPARPIPEQRQPFKILMADDNPNNISLLSRYLQSDGYNLITAWNGVETLKKTRAELPDLILLDVNMPEKDGFQVLQEIRSDPAIEHIPVIILTAARLDPVDKHFALNLGADDYVTKPFDRRELLARIHTKLRVKEAQDIIRRQNKELSLLPEIGKDLSARLDVNELIDVVLHRTVETIGAMSGYMVVLNSAAPIHKEYRLSATSDGVQIPSLTSLLEQITETRQGLIISNTKEDPRWEIMAGDPTRSAIIVPMFGRLGLIGVLILTHEKVGYFNLGHRLLLEAITSQAAIALENAQLYAGKAQEEQRITAVLKNVADAVLMFDEDSQLSLLNPAAEKLFVDYDARLGLPIARGCGYDELIEFLEKTFSSCLSQAGEITWPDARIFAVQATPIDNGGCVVLMHDVSHFKALERAKDEFISTASHDLKNPITSIIGFSELLSRAGPLNDMQTDFARRIQASAKHMSQLVQDLLVLAKVDMNVESMKELVSLQTLVPELIDEFQSQAAAKKQTLLLTNSDSPADVLGDPLQLKQVIVNLVSNAIKYTPDEGSIQVVIETHQDQVVFKVKDTGYGIPASDLPFIFDRFYRVRNDEVRDIEGNGLGLAIVKAIINQHGGQIDVESTLGKGSCFTFIMPLAQRDPIALVNSDGEGKTDFKGVK